MARYDSLLIGAGGGIIDHRKQSDRRPGATVIIGLGGTGSDAVIKLKQEVYKQLKPDDVDSPIPRYKDIRYLVIDADLGKFQSGNGKLSDIDRKVELFSIANPHVKAVFENKAVLKGRRELDWLNYANISIDEAAYGTLGIRQVGRFLLVDKAMDIYAKIKSTILNALLGSAGGLTVHICAGLSGGTGSGTFLDICYMVRQVLRELDRSDTAVCGYFFLPDVSLSVPAISASSLTSHHVCVNGYAALQELDYCMNFNYNGDRFDMNYGFMRIQDSQPPVDLCNLISTTDEKGKMISNGYDYAMGVVTDFIINDMVLINLPDDMKTPTEGITLKGLFANLEAVKAGIQLQHGANVGYNVLGGSVAEMPLSEIAVYLGYKLFESYAGMYSKTPTKEGERDDFMRVSPYSWLTVPYDSAEIKEAARIHAEKRTGYIVRESSITDRISVMRFYSGLPMYAYQGLLELRAEYEGETRPTPGRHLFERGDVN